MAELYQNLFIIVCISLLGWGVIRVERIYQYPFFMGSMFVSFFLPQAFALISNPGAASLASVERVLLFSTMCAAACFIGYEMKPNRNWLSNLNIAIDERKLFIGGIALMTQGYFFNFLLSRTAVQTAANGNWTGPATIYLFLGQVINIAFAIFLLQLLKRPNILNLTCAAISSWPLLQSVLGGRRQPTMTLIIIIGLSLWMGRRLIPPRWSVITALIFMTILIPLFGEVRSGFWNLVFSGNWQAVSAIAQKAFNQLLKGELLEIRNAALLMDVVERTGLYGFGSGYWDSIIFQYVPGQIVGFELKKSLQVNLFDKYVEYLSSFYGYTIPNGYTITGVGDSFIEFSYFGCFTFGLIAYLFKHLWISSVYQKSTFSRILYMGLVSPAMVGLTHGIGRFLQEAIFQAIFIGLVAFYARKKNHFSYIESQKFER